MSMLRSLRRLLPTLVLLAVLTLGAAAPAAALPAPATARLVTTSVSSPAGGAPAVSPDDADDHDDDFGWGPSRVVWGGFGWLGVVLVTALLLRRRASRRR